MRNGCLERGLLLRSGYEAVVFLVLPGGGDLGHGHYL
jgi:hypothetical protein